MACDLRWHSIARCMAGTSLFFKKRVVLAVFARCSWREKVRCSATLSSWWKNSRNISREFMVGANTPCLYDELQDHSLWRGWWKSLESYHPNANLWLSVLLSSLLIREISSTSTDMRQGSISIRWCIVVSTSQVVWMKRYYRSIEVISTRNFYLNRECNELIKNAQTW